MDISQIRIDLSNKKIELNTEKNIRAWTTGGSITCLTLAIPLITLFGMAIYKVNIQRNLIDKGILTIEDVGFGWTFGLIGGIAGGFYSVVGCLLLGSFALRSHFDVKATEQEIKDLKDQLPPEEAEYWDNE